MMKKGILVIATLLIASTAFSQSFTIGPRAGLSSSNLNIKENVDNVKQGEAEMGFHAGLFARLQLLGVYVQPEALFTSSGGNLKVTPDNAQERIVNYEYNKLDVPVMVGFRVAKVLRINAGPVASYLLGGDIRDNATGEVQDIKSNYNEASIGYQAGIGIDLWKLVVDLKYEGNLSKWSDQVNVPGINSSFPTDQRGRQLILSVGIKLN